MTVFVDPFDDLRHFADEAQAAPAEAPAETVFDAPPAEAPAPAKKAPAKAAAKKDVATATVDVKPNLLPLNEGKVVLTFKGGSGFDAPWVVIHATNLQDAYEQVSGENAALLAALMERVQAAGKHFAGLAPASTGGSAPRPQRQAAPAPAQQPPAGSPAAPGPDWVYKTGVTKSGRNAGQTWQAWMPPQGSQERPVFF